MTMGEIPFPSVKEMEALWSLMIAHQINIVDFEHSHGCAEYFSDHNSFTISYNKAQAYLQYVHDKEDTPEYLRHYPAVYWSGQLMTQYPKFFQQVEGIQHLHAHYHHRPDVLFPLVWALRESTWLQKAHDVWEPHGQYRTPENWLTHVFSYSGNHEQLL